MVAAFSGLHIGTSAIHAAQRGLNITGQNIANSATPGYTRQRVDLEAVGGPGVPAFWSKYDGTGEGVKVTGVTRMTDAFLVARANNAQASLGELSEMQKTMGALERTINEPSDTGLQKKLAEMWNAFGAAGNSPSVANQAPRSEALERAKEVAAQLNHMSNATTTQWGDTANELKANVTDINKMAEDIAKLNVAIRNNDIAKVPSNELLDQRDQLIAKLSDLTGATVRPAEMDQGGAFNSHAVDVMIGDQALVYGTKAGTLEIDPPPAVAPDYSYADDGGDGVEFTVSLTLAENDDTSTGGIIDIKAGRVAGQLTTLNETIPNYLDQFDKIAFELADTVNLQQGDGYTVDGRDGSDHPIFVAEDDGAITAANIRVPKDFVPNDMAVSRGNPKDTDTTQASLDGNNFLEMSRHINDKDGADSLYNSMVVQLGVETQSVNRKVKVQENVVRQAEDARDNVSGVSLNEEMTNMIQFQHSFSAAAKFIATIDQTLDTLINMKR